MSGIEAWLLEPLQFRFVVRGLAMALLLGVSGGLVGCILLLRRMSLMADSFGHSLLPGIALAFLFIGHGMGSLFIGAALAGLFTVLISALVNRLTRLKEDAAFAALFALSFAIGTALMSRIATSIDFLHYLFGDILAITRGDLMLSAGATALTIICCLVFYRVLLIASFDQIFHRSCGGRTLLVQGVILTIVVIDLVAALQAVGMVLELGLFILPATTAYLWVDRFGTLLTLSALIGGVGAMLGLYASYHLQLPSGSCMVSCLGLAFIVSTLASPRHGIIMWLIRRRDHLREDADGRCDTPS